MNPTDRPARAGNSHVRYWILATVFLLTAVNYADRSAISIAGSAVKTDLGISASTLGWIFSAFGWSYVVAQIPGGAFLDRYGSKAVYLTSIIAWSICTFLSGFASFLAPGSAVIALFILRLGLGAVEAPAFPANARLTAAWFPDAERGTASAIFNAAQYGATIVFAPLMGLIVDRLGWHDVFFVMGVIGLVAAAIFAAVVYAPGRHPRVSQAELDHITAGGAQVQLDAPSTAPRAAFSWRIVGELLSNRMLFGIYFAQYCVNGLTYFFTTWFPVYLVQARGLSYTQAGFGAAVPAVAALAGGILGGLWSDRLIKSGRGISFSRKLPIIVGMVCALFIVLCNYTSSLTLVIALMSLAFFGKGMGALGWAVISDSAPREVTGLSGSIFNMIANISGIVTPIVIGYIVSATGSFDLALWFVAAHAVMIIVSYTVIVGPIRRFSLRSLPAQGSSAVAAPLATPAPVPSR